MFGLNDNNDNSYGNQAQAGQDGSPAPGPAAPVHGPFSNLSPGGPNMPAPVQPGPVAPPGPINDIQPPQSPASSHAAANEDELLDIKQQALQSLTPLVSHLEQTPEEKFKTTMMLIQASDNPQLLQEAFEAANKIEDEKLRAQALLDVVNEINYFTHQLNGEG